MKPYETLTVCGSEYRFKITAANAVKLESELKTDLISGLDKVAEIGILARYLYYAGISLNDNISTIDDVYTLIDDYITDGGSLKELQDFIIETLFTSGILTQQMYDASKKFAGKQQEALQNLLK